MLSRLDTPLSIKGLTALTGFDESRLVQIIEELVAQGAIDVDSDRPAASAASQAPSETEAGDEVSVSDELEPSGQDDEDAPEEVARQAAGAREYQKIYESIFHPLSRDGRVAAALVAFGPNLFALCFDPDPHVVGALLTNPKSNLEHARLIATHHHTNVGLDLLGRRSECLADAQVQRRLLANPQLPDSLLRKIVQSKLLADVYKIAVNREIPERSRIMTRELLQKKFLLASPDERAALLFRTEGRCLVVLVNCALDARTTQMLVSKSAYTVLFIQNLARWSATPPALLAHLLKQPVVRQNVGLRKQILRHRNVPSEVKRSSS